MRKVKDLMEYLARLNQEALVVIHRDVDDYGYGEIDKIITGLYTETDYGGDFFRDQRLVINPREVEAICIYSERYQEPLEIKDEKTS